MANKRTIRKPFERERQPKTFEGHSLAKQASKAECDINTILKRYQKTGLVTHVAQYAGRYEELPSDIDYQAGLNAILQAEAAFASLPAKIRSRFHNDPTEFLGFVQDPANAEELVSMGLATRIAEPSSGTPAEDPPREAPPTAAPVP